jgi:hypothetical protein
MRRFAGAQRDREQGKQQARGKRHNRKRDHAVENQKKAGQAEQGFESDQRASHVRIPPGDFCSGVLTRQQRRFQPCRRSVVHACSREIVGRNAGNKFTGCDARNVAERQPANQEDQASTAVQTVKRSSCWHLGQPKILISVSRSAASVRACRISPPHRQVGTSVDPGSSRRSNMTPRRCCNAAE